MAKVAIVSPRRLSQGLLTVTIVLNYFGVLLIKVSHAKVSFISIFLEFFFFDKESCWGSCLELTI